MRTTYDALQVAYKHLLYVGAQMQSRALGSIRDNGMQHLPSTVKDLLQTFTETDWRTTLGVFYFIVILGSEKITRVRM